MSGRLFKENGFSGNFDSCPAGRMASPGFLNEKN